MSLLTTIVFLSGCGESVEEKLYTTLEETVEIEESNETSKKLNELEIKDKKLLNEIASLTDEKLEEINKKSEEAIEINKDLKEALEEEKTTFDEAEKEFEKSESLINKIEEDSEKELALEMYEVMIDRYATYDELAKEYEVTIDERIKFYGLMKEEDVEEEKALKQVEQINKHNEQIIKLNNRVNENTEKYNVLKKELYGTIDLNIEYKD